MFMGLPGASPLAKIASIPADGIAKINFVLGQRSMTMRTTGTCLAWIGLIALIGLMHCTAFAQDGATLQALIDQGAKRVSKAELEALIPGSRHESRGQTGSYRQWTHYPDGTLMGDLKSGFSASSPRGHGQWSVNNFGQYCVDIKWGQSGAEKWCRSTFRLGDDYFGVPDSRKTESTPFKFALKK
jgi:hypothetical protein